MSSADEHRLERAKAEIVVRLGRELLGAKVEEGDDLGGEGFGGPEALREEHDLGDKLPVGTSHRHASEELLEVVGEVGTTGVARIHWGETRQFRNEASLVGECALVMKMPVSWLMRSWRPTSSISALALVIPALSPS